MVVIGKISYGMPFFENYKFLPSLYSDLVKTGKSPGRVKY